MKKILFVDDEPNVLQGLRRTLHGMRDQWVMDFVAKASTAIEKLQQSRFDVVVSDMRMPEIDGAELLETVREHDPSIARIVLSGQTDINTSLRTAGIAHQFLIKPCRVDTLIASIHKACSLRERLCDREILRIVSGLHALPAIPEIYHQLTNEMASEDMSLTRIAGIVEQDIALSAKILQLVNSAYFGVPRHIESIEWAVSYLGANTIRSLSLSVAAFGAFDGYIRQEELQTIRDHSVQVGTVASAIASFETKSKHLVDDAFQAGILHDIGKLVLLTVVPDEYRLAVEPGLGPAHDAVGSERNAFGCDHADIGSYLLSLWGLPDAIAEAVGDHHRAFAGAADEFSAATAVWAANKLVVFLAEQDPQSSAALEHVPNTVGKWLEVAATALNGDAS